MKPGRGMSKAPFLRDGCELIELTDSQNRCIASITLVPGVSPSLARRVLRELIDAADPVAELRIVR